MLIIQIAMIKLLANFVANAVTDNNYTFHEYPYLDKHAN